MSDNLLDFAYSQMLSDSRFAAWPNPNHSRILTPRQSKNLWAATQSHELKSKVVYDARRSARG